MALDGGHRGDAVAGDVRMRYGTGIRALSRRHSLPHMGDDGAEGVHAAKIRE